MYTGITKGLFPVVSVDQQPFLTTYVVELNDTLSKGLSPGDSVSIDGVCQTVVSIQETKVTFQAIEETLSKTTLQNLFQGRLVSVERSARFGDENGGHEIAGHIFCTGTIVKRISCDNNLTLVIKPSAQAWKYIFEKGFIAIDGSSLTIGNLDQVNQTFGIHLIPETLRLTNFGAKKVGDKVNIEVDAKAVILAEGIERYFLPLQERIESLEKKIEAATFADKLYKDKRESLDSP